MHNVEMDCSTGKCYGSDRICTPVTKVTNPVPLPTELYPHPLMNIHNETRSYVYVNHAILISLQSTVLSFVYQDAFDAFNVSSMDAGCVQYEFNT